MGQMRSFDQAPSSLPPHPCRLCDESFATLDCLLSHLECRHHGFLEYRKELFFKQQQLDAVRRITPQEWRHCLEGFAEELVTGSSDWPQCPAYWKKGVISERKMQRKFPGVLKKDYYKFADDVLRACSLPPWRAPVFSMSELRDRSEAVVNENIYQVIARRASPVPRKVVVRVVKIRRRTRKCKAAGVNHLYLDL